MSRRKTAIRRIAVVTGTRAEFGLLEPVLRAMKDRRGLRSDLIVTGMHLLPKFGRTIDTIRQRGWSIAATVPMQSGRDNTTANAEAVARGVSGIAKALDRLGSEIVLVLGDRIEAFAGAVAAVTTRRILGHIHGGDGAVGDLDGPLRDAITRLAHVHFAASRHAAHRLRRMGEEPSRIHVVGAPGLDEIMALRQAEQKDPQPSKEIRFKLLGDLADKPYALVVQHPCGRTANEEQEFCAHMVQAVSKAGLGAVAIYPNSDYGHAGIIRALQRARREHAWKLFRSLPRETYLHVAMHAAVLVGNSSSGVIESASLGVNAVNIGERQQGRPRCGPGVIDCEVSPAAMMRAIGKALSKPRPRLQRSLYGDGQAGRRIAALLDGLIITPTVWSKRLTF